MSMSSGGAVDVTQRALKKPRKEGPVAPHGRKRAEPIELGDDSAGGGYVDEKALRAVAAIAGKDKNYLKWSQRTARKPGKQRGWRQGPDHFNFAAHRRETAKVTAKLNTEAVAAWRAEAQNELQAAMSDQSWGTLHSLLVMPDAKEGDGEVFVSEAQHHRLHLQAMSVYNHYLLVGKKNLRKNLRWCAEEASMRTGCQVEGCTIYDSSLEFT
jgi:hypothetical protein